MALFSKVKEKKAAMQQQANADTSLGSSGEDVAVEKGHHDNSPVPLLTLRTFFMAVLVSMGGIVFGYDTGQISGFISMHNFLENFAERGADGTYAFSVVREGLIVGMLSIGTLIGALIAAPIANMRAVGRKFSVCIWCIIFSVGVVIQIASMRPHWYQLMIGRIIAGFGIGALSVIVPMYQSESCPAHIRGAVVCCYQLFITIGILIAYLINYGTEAMNNTGSWRIVMGVGWLWAIILGCGILFFPETPRFEYRHGKLDSARASIAKFHGVHEHHIVVHKQMDEMAEKLAMEKEGGDHPWYEVVTGPRMAYRTALGMTIQALQQLTGANYFFYYGTTIFKSVGLSNSFVTQIILGAVNVGCTFPGLYFIEKYGRRKCLTIGALWQFMCFIIFASLGQFKLNDPAGDPNGKANQGVGYGMIILAVFFIASFASTWGPQAWAVISEIYPSRYRSQCIALCSASNWTFNFLLAFFTPFITNDIYFAYGYVFAGCNLAAFFIVYFFLPETKGRSLEEVDTMYLLHVTPWKSSKWTPPEGEELVTADNLALNRGGRGITKRNEAEVGDDAQIENNRPGQGNLPEVPIVSGERHQMGAGVRGDSFMQ